jgi:hypothetical protein
MAKRQLSDAEKQVVVQNQRERDGSLRCFISGEVIDPNSDEVEFDHVQAFATDGPTDIINVKAVLKKYNRRKGTQTLYEVRENLRLERLFELKKNSIKLQDILQLKDVEQKSTHANIEGNSIALTDGNEQRTFALLQDTILGVSYFYGRVPMIWLQNDDQEGLQPRVIDQKRLTSLRGHLRTHPQIAPAVARLIDSNVRLFDGQHKVAAQVLNDVQEIDVKVYISPSEPEAARKLFDALMITNLEAHSSLRQVPFYTSTLLERFSVVYKDLCEEFTTTKPQSEHSEEKFVDFLARIKGFTKAKALSIFRAQVKENIKSMSPITRFIATASKDKTYPLTDDLMEEIYKQTLYLQPSEALFDTAGDYRNQESDNFRELSEMLIEYGMLELWVPRTASTTLTDVQRKARRIWHKGSVLTWAPYLKDILCNAFNMVTQDERTHMLYRPIMNNDQRSRIETGLKRLFEHTMWDMPEGEIDSLLVSAQKQDAFFKTHNLTAQYVVIGTIQ